MVSTCWHNESVFWRYEVPPVVVASLARLHHACACLPLPLARTIHILFAERFPDYAAAGKTKPKSFISEDMVRTLWQTWDNSRFPSIHGYHHPGHWYATQFESLCGACGQKDAGNMSGCKSWKYSVVLVPLLTARYRILPEIGSPFLHLAPGLGTRLNRMKLFPCNLCFND